MRKLRQSILDILDPTAADDVFRLLIVGLPEPALVDPAGFPQQAFAEAECREHLHRAACDAIGLPEQQGPRFLLYDAGLDIGERGKLGREGEPSRPAADDENINFLG